MTLAFEQPVPQIRSLIPAEYASAARDRILYYFRRYPRTIINGDELLVVSGIQEYARRVRELRVQLGWTIASGVTIKEMHVGGEEDIPEQLKDMKPSDYILLSETQDRDSAHRWNVANTIRKEHGSVRDKLLKFLLANVAQGVTNEELRYVAGDKTEWARRVRELRTEFGWPIATKTTGLPEWASVSMCFSLIGRAPRMTGTFQMTCVGRCCAATYTGAKTAIGHTTNGTLRTPGI